MKNQKTPPSIFNDVIGPVMRGPSSSHTAASVRIGRMVRQMLGEKPAKVLFEFDQNGSLATTYENQGSAMGLAAGLLDWEITHPEIQNALKVAKEKDIQLDFKIVAFPADHPNTYKISAKGISGKKMDFVAISTGGGMIEFRQFDDFEVSLKGDYYESIFVFNELTEDKSEKLIQNIRNHFRDCLIYQSAENGKELVNIKSGTFVFHDAGEILEDHTNVLMSSNAEPVLPVLSGSKRILPFSSFEEMLTYADNCQIKLSDLALDYESARAGIGIKEVFDKMNELVEITRDGIRKGLKGTKYSDRILGRQSHLILKAEKEHDIISSPTNRIIAYTSALMEVKSSMGVIIAAPTAGACGVLGGAIFGATDMLDDESETLTRAFLAAGLIGVFIAKEYTFAAEEGGCQVECGAGSGMAAAGLTELMGGNYSQVVRAASMAMQNLIGLICDPVADRVEVPCLGKNILGATNALNAANMSMAGFEEVIPLNEVIDAIKRVGNEMPSSVCCTGLSGLSTTPCSKKIFKQLKKKKEK